MAISVKTIDIEPLGQRGPHCRTTSAADIKGKFFVRVNKRRRRPQGGAGPSAFARAATTRRSRAVLGAVPKRLKTGRQSRDFATSTCAKRFPATRIISQNRQRPSGNVLRRRGAIDYLEQYPRRSSTANNILVAQGNQEDHRADGGRACAHH